MARILSIDYGQKRTGIAVTDDFQIIASGLTTIPSTDIIAYLKTYFSKENVETVIIGEPKQMNGLPSESTEIIEKFISSFTHNLPKVLFVFMPIFAFFLWLFHNKKRWYYFDHGIFTLHYFSFLLLIFLDHFLFLMFLEVKYLEQQFAF